MNEWEKPEFFREEVLCDHVVGTDMKKIWAVELDILAEFDRVCRKNGLRYYAEYGTLLGAVRHHGYIPWDDDIDVSMPREDYKKLADIAKDEFKYPYAYRDGYSGYAITPFAKVMRVDTAAVERPELPPEFPQGIFMDIMPIDAVPDGRVETLENWKRLLEYWSLLKYPVETFDRLCAGEQFLLGAERIIEVAQMQPEMKLRELEDFAYSIVGSSDKVNVFLFYIKSGGGVRDISWYDDTVYMPYEGFDIPCPGGYHEILTSIYGDYMTPIKGAGTAHEIQVFDTEKPYTDYLTGGN